MRLSRSRRLLLDKRIALAKMITEQVTRVFRDPGIQVVAAPFQRLADCEGDR